MTSWGGYDNHLRVGIDWSISPSSPSHNDTTVNVTWTWYVDSDGWNFNDTQTMHESATGYSNDVTFNDTTSGSAQKVNSHTETYGISYNSGNVTASGNISGAYNGATPSHSVTVNLPNRPVAAPSAGEAPSASSVGTTDVTITWGAPDDNGGDSPDEYQLEVSTSSSFSSTVYNNTATYGTRSQHVTGLNPNTHYYARVRAHNSAGWGDWTSSTYCQFTTLAGTPSTPGNLGYTAKDQTSITVGWSASAQNGGGAVTYTVECALDSAFTTGLLIDTTTATSYQFTGLTPGTIYYFRVKGTNSSGTSAWSSTISAATKAVTTYTDSGDYVTLVNNLASAAADKLVHLGITLWRGKTGSVTIPSSTFTTVNMGTFLELRGPDEPTWLDSGTSDFQINYPGTYLIEFAFRFGEGAWTGKHINMDIYVNGNQYPASTNIKAGGETPFAVTDNYTTPMRNFTIVRRLDVGDTVGWGVWQNSGSSITTPSTGASDLSCYAKVTLIGF